jgi:hypothetical protein
MAQDKGPHLDDDMPDRTPNILCRSPLPHPILVEFVRSLARIAAREYSAENPRDSRSNAPSAPEEPCDEGRPLRPLLQRRPARRIDR